MSEFENKVAVITGGASGIGKCIAEEFTKAGAKVSVIDIAKEGKHFVGDISNKKVLEEYVEYMIYTLAMREDNNIGIIKVWRVRMVQNSAL